MGRENHTRRWVLDVSRLFARLHHAAPRGIDRVQMRYVTAFLQDPDARFCVFARGRWVEVPRSMVRDCAAMVARRWELGDTSRVDAMTRRVLAVTTRFRGVREPALAAVGRRLRGPTATPGERIVYVNVSHKELHHIGSLRRCFESPVDIVVLLHDLMPITRPAEFGPTMRATFTEGVECVRRHADLVIANSEATSEELDDHWGAAAHPPVVTVGLGHERSPQLTTPPGAPPRFVFLGPSEPRKNLGLVLDVWRSLASRRGPVPHLHIIGPGAAQVSSEIPNVQVHEAPADAEVRRLLVGSRALLVPSRAEGFGLPVIEALALRTPAICSDLPSLREASQGLAEHLPVDDVEAWARHVRSYADESSAPRQAQLERLADFRLPEWSTHFEALYRALDGTEPRRARFPLRPPPELGDALRRAV